MLAIRWSSDRRKKPAKQQLIIVKLNYLFIIHFVLAIKRKQSNMYQRSMVVRSAYSIETQTECRVILRSAKVGNEHCTGIPENCVRCYSPVGVELNQRGKNAKCNYRK